MKAGKPICPAALSAAALLFTGRPACAQWRGDWGHGMMGDWGMGWLGGIFMLVFWVLIIHSAHKLDSLIGVLTFLAMLVVVLSGITGRYLFRRVHRTLKDQQQELSKLREIFHKRREEIVSCRPHFGPETAGGKGIQAEAEDERIEEELQEQCGRLYDLALSISELEYSTTFFDSIRSSFSRWMRVHHVLTIFLFALAFVHILTVLYYGLRWFG